MQVRLFAAAADAAGVRETQVEGDTLGAVLDELVARHGERFGQVLGRCTLLLDGVRVDDPALSVADARRLDVLPPFAGG